MSKLIVEAITEHYGERCPDFDAECFCCKVWDEYDALVPPAPCDELETVKTEYKWLAIDGWKEQPPIFEEEIEERRELVTRQNAEEVIAAKYAEIAELKKLISSTHKNAVKHTECDTVNCLICDGGLFMCADCGAVEIETEQKICTGSMAALEAENAELTARIQELENEIIKNGEDEDLEQWFFWRRKAKKTAQRCSNQKTQIAGMAKKVIKLEAENKRLRKAAKSNELEKRSR